MTKYKELIDMGALTQRIKELESNAVELHKIIDKGIEDEKYLRKQHDNYRDLSIALQAALLSTEAALHHVVKCKECVSSLLKGVNLCAEHRKLVVKSVNDIFIAKDKALSLSLSPTSEQKDNK